MSQPGRDAGVSGETSGLSVYGNGSPDAELSLVYLNDGSGAFHCRPSWRDDPAQAELVIVCYPY